MTERLLTKHEAIDVLRCSRPTLDRIISRGELAVVRVSERTVRISEDAVRDFLARRTERRGQ